LPPTDTIIRDKESAAGYDDQALATNWFGSDVVFGLVYEYVNPGETLLDLGIGSGLSSILFHRAGLRVYGLDGSEEVLKVCQAKNFTVDLKLHDLREYPLPYESSSLNHIISVAVLNSFSDLDPLFGETARIIKPQGVFAFTVEDQKPGQEESYPINRVEVDKAPDEENAVRLFRHSSEYINRLLVKHNYRLLKKLEFLGFKYPAENQDIYFTAYIARKSNE